MIPYKAMRQWPDQRRDWPVAWEMPEGVRKYDIAMSILVLHRTRGISQAGYHGVTHRQVAKRLGQRELAEAYDAPPTDQAEQAAEDIVDPESRMSPEQTAQAGALGEPPGLRGALGIPPSPPQTPAKRRSPPRGAGDDPARPHKATRLGEPYESEGVPQRPFKASRREASPRGAHSGGVQQGGSSSSKP